MFPKQIVPRYLTQGCSTAVLRERFDAIKSPFVARVQEHQARENLRRCRAEAAASGLRELSRNDVAMTVRQRIMRRRAGRPVPRAGRLRIFLAYPHESWLKVLPMSLEPFGEVVSFDLRAQGIVRGTGQQWVRDRARLDELMVNSFRAANQKAPIDVVVGYLSGDSTSPLTLQAMANEGAAVFNFCWDDKLTWPGIELGGRYVSPAAIAAAVDLNLTNAPDSVVKYAVYGGLAMFWPEAAHPLVHRPIPASFEFDVTFVGGKYGWRPRLVESLRASGIDVQCFGSGWSNGELTDEEMVRLYSRSRINLGFSGIGHSHRLMCLKGRDFEVPMSGGLYLTQGNPELGRVYRVGEEIVTYRDERDCVNTIKRLLGDPDTCRRIRERGRARALRDHTYEARWRELFTLAGFLE